MCTTLLFIYRLLYDVQMRAIVIFSYVFVVSGGPMGAEAGTLTTMIGQCYHGMSYVAFRH